MGAEPPPDFAAQMADEYQRLLDLLGDETLRQVAVWKMEGYSSHEIADKLACSRRTDPRSPRIHEVLTAAQVKGEKMPYLRNHWDALQLFVSDGRMPIDNNEVEQLMKQVALGRKNWLFLGSLEAGTRAATLLTIVSTAVRNDLDVWAYLNDVLKQLLAGSTDYHSFRADIWKQTHPEAVRTYRADERRDAAESVAPAVGYWATARRNSPPPWPQPYGRRGSAPLPASTATSIGRASHCVGIGAGRAVHCVGISIVRGSLLGKGSTHGAGVSCVRKIGPVRSREAPSILPQAMNSASSTTIKSVQWNAIVRRISWSSHCRTEFIPFGRQMKLVPY